MSEDLIADYRSRVRPEWIDHNGHMNVAYYVLAFDLASDVLFERLGLDEAYRRARNCGTFVVEAHVTYGRELLVDAPMRFESRVVEAGPKKLRYFLEMFHAEQGYRAATAEFMGIAVDLTTRRAVPFSPEMQERLAAAAARDRLRGMPAEIGRAIGQPRAKPPG